MFSEQLCTSELRDYFTFRMLIIHSTSRRGNDPNAVAIFQVSIRNCATGGIGVASPREINKHGAGGQSCSIAVYLETSHEWP